MNLRMHYNFVLICVFFYCFVHISICLDDENPFKMGKMNVIWRKAKQILKEKKMTELYADLAIQDRKEKDLKQQRFDGKDKFGLLEADVRKSLVDIIEKYGLSEYFPKERMTEGKKPTRDSAYELKDEKLKELLKKARKEGFSDTEIQLLKEELGHHQLKLDEYNSLKQEYEALEEKVDNSLDNLDDQEKVWSELAQKKQEMKDKHKDYKEGLKRLKDKVADKDNSAGVFEDPRVHKLWALAQKVGMSEEELGSVRKELTHFENRIRKAEHIQNELDKVDQKRRAGGKVDNKQHEELKQKAEQFHKKVDKYHKDLEKRIFKHLDEL